MKRRLLIFPMVFLIFLNSVGYNQALSFSTSTVPLAPQSSRLLLPVRGLYVSFERRGRNSMYYSGETIDNFLTFDPVVGHTVADEVSMQLDEMAQMGVNTIAFELRSADPTSAPFVFPTCNINPSLGLQYPRPTSLEIDNLIAFLDMLDSKGMKVFLMLINTHMEEQPPTNNELWLSTILSAIKNHPALDLVVFDGSPHWIDSNGDGLSDACGLPAEPPLWMGPTNVGAQYVKWAIGYANSLGLPYRKLSAEAIIGDYYAFNQGPSGPDATDEHLWDPVYVLKGIFDDLSIPDNQRTYAISFYEHRKCTTARQLSCADTNPQAWAIETVKNLFTVIGRGNGARVDAVEMGLTAPVEPGWNTELALESWIWIMQNYGIEGGCFYHWTSFTGSEDFDPTFASPIKQRGTEMIFNPVKDILESLYTVGQTDDLNLTPDNTPPIFGSVSTTPGVVKNGDVLKISANLGETHLFVTAEMTAMDTAKNDTVVLIDQGDGAYERNVSISSWNEAGNGIKNLQLSAMDFWGNAASTSVAVNLQNPAPILDTVPPNDLFDGKTINSNKWKNSYVNGGGAITQDSKLMMTTGDAQATSNALEESVWDFTGDFDAQVDFQIAEGWSIPTTGDLNGAILGMYIAGQSYHVSRLRRESGDDVIFSWSSTGISSSEAATQAVTGKYRIRRNGTTLIFLFDIGRGWEEIAHTIVPSSYAKVYLGNASVNAFHAMTTYFDNFQINSGLTTYRMKTYLPLTIN
jgi:hypothetical protein